MDAETKAAEALHTAWVEGDLERRTDLEYALDNDERHGVYGGLSERERRRLKRAAS